MNLSKKKIVIGGCAALVLAVAAIGLGRRQALVHGAGPDQELSLRHSEIMLLLATSADGLSSAELGVALSDDDQAMVTIRAELSRLRSQLGIVTGDFGPRSGTMRLDYVLPSTGFSYLDGGVFWPAAGTPEAAIADGSDHHLVWVDVR